MLVSSSSYFKDYTYMSINVVCIILPVLFYSVIYLLVPLEYLALYGVEL